MKTWASIVGVLLAGLLIVGLKSEGVRQQLAELFAGSSSSATTSPVSCTPGGLVSAECARQQSGPLVIRPQGAAPGFAVQTLLEVRPTGAVPLPPSREALTNSGLIQSIAAELNAMFALPRDIPVKLTACGEPNAFYDTGAQAISICDEWVDYLGEAFADIESPEEFTRAVLFAAAFAFAHEVGHALIHQYQLNYTGSEEDVADQFAVYVLAGTPTGAEIVLAGADAFGRFAEAGGPVMLWDNHPLDAQRYFNILCWTYGSDPARFPVILTNTGLPLERARNCQYEFARMAGDFDQKLQAHLRSTPTVRLTRQPN